MVCFDFLFPKNRHLCLFSFRIRRTAVSHRFDLFLLSDHLLSTFFPKGIFFIGRQWIPKVFLIKVIQLILRMQIQAQKLRRKNFKCSTRCYAVSHDSIWVSISRVTQRDTRLHKRTSAISAKTIKTEREKTSRICIN